MPVPAEDYLRLKLSKYLEDDQIILIRFPDIRSVTTVKDDGSLETSSEVVGVTTYSVPVSTLADIYRDIIEDDDDYPVPKFPAWRDKVFTDASGNIYDPGYKPYFQKWIDERLE